MIVELYDLLYSLHASYIWNDDVKNNRCEGSQDGGDHSGHLVVSRNAAPRGNVTASWRQAIKGKTGLAGRPIGLLSGSPSQLSLLLPLFAQPRSVRPSDLCLPEPTAWTFLSPGVPASSSPCTHTVQASMKPAIGKKPM